MRAKIGKKGIKKRIVRAVLALAMVVALMPMNSLTAYAADDPLLVTITEDPEGGSVTPVYSEANIATLTTTGNNNVTWDTSSGSPIAIFGIGTINGPGTFTVAATDSDTYQITKVEFVTQKSGVIFTDTSAPFSLYSSGWKDSGAMTGAKTSLDPTYSSGVETGGQARAITEIRVYGKALHQHTDHYGVTTTTTANDTLTWYCGAGCPSGAVDAAHAVKLTFTASSANYSGIDNLSAFNTATGRAGKNAIYESDVKFYKVSTAGATTGGELVSGTLTADGYYYASLTVGPATAVKAFTIGNPSIAVTDVTLDKSSIILTAGSTEILTATVIPDNATDKAVTWKSSNDSIATVDNGVVTAVAEGSAVITVTTHDGSKTATCDVTVNKATHTHCFNYSASGATLTAKCGIEGCDFKVSLVLSAEDTGYTGKSYSGASLAGVDAWKKAGLDIPEIEYCGRGDTKHDSKIPPKDVGTYTAKITVGCATASVDFAITEDKPKKQGKTDEERIEEQRQIAAMIAAYQDFFEFHPQEWAYVNEQYAINPALGLDATLKMVANSTYEEYMAQMAAYFAQYADQMALYEAMMNAQNAQ